MTEKYLLPGVGSIELEMPSTLGISSTLGPTKKKRKKKIKRKINRGKKNQIPLVINSSTNSSQTPDSKKDTGHSLK